MINILPVISLLPTSSRFTLQYLLCNDGWSSFKHFCFRASMRLRVLSRGWQRDSAGERGTPVFPAVAQWVTGVGVRTSGGGLSSHVFRMHCSLVVSQCSPGVASGHLHMVFSIRTSCSAVLLPIPVPRFSWLTHHPQVCLLPLSQQGHLMLRPPPPQVLHS